MPTRDERIDLVFRALASKPRREILKLLASHGAADDSRCCGGEEVCACVFAERLGLSAPTVSHHMKSLLDAGLVSAEKRGLWVYYRLNAEAFEPLMGELGELTSCPNGACC
jgi:ArsR family transcriptional regulator